MFEDELDHKVETYRIEHQGLKNMLAGATNKYVWLPTLGQFLFIADIMMNKSAVVPVLNEFAV